MKILLLGSGGREHALAWKIAQSPRVDKLFIAPGNAGTAAVGENVDLSPSDFDGIAQFVIDYEVQMVVVGPEDPLVKGVYDYFQHHDLLKDVAVIGLPDKRLGEITGAIISIKDGMTCTEEEINEYCMELPRYKRPKRIIFADVPRNATGKIEKPALRKKYGADQLVAQQNNG